MHIPWPERLFLISALLAVLVAIAHAMCLPVGFTYDGLQYLDLADVLGSSRSPEDWHEARTPLFPLALLVGLLTWNARLLALCAIPVANLVPFAVLMDSYDRYALPAYPMFLADLVILALLLGAEIARRRAAAASRAS